MLYLTLWLPNSLHVKRSPWARSYFSCRFHFKNVSYSSELHYDRKRQWENHKQSSCLRDRATFSRVNDFTVFWIIGLRLRKYNLPSKERQMGAKLNETLCIVTKFRELLENYFLTFVIPMCDNESPSESNHDKLCLWRVIYDDFQTSRGNWSLCSVRLYSLSKSPCWMISEKEG